MAKLTDNTIVVHPETGEPVLLAATGEVPDWAVDLVGDHLLDGPVKRSAKSAQPSPGEAAEVAALRARIAELEAAQKSGADDADVEVPPRSGPGSGAQAWREYATSQGVEVADDASREEVISALKSAGKPVE
jgi:hypothetical protein